MSNLNKHFIKTMFFKKHRPCLIFIYRINSNFIFQSIITLLIIFQSTITFYHKNRLPYCYTLNWALENNSHDGV